MAAREEKRNHARKDIILTHEEVKHRFRKASDAQHKQKTEELNNKQTFPTTTTRPHNVNYPCPTCRRVSPLRRAAMNTHHSSDRADCGVRACMVAGKQRAADAHPFLSTSPQQKQHRQKVR